MNLSFSAVDLWRRCPFAFNLRYVQKIDIPSDNLFSAFGNAIHSTIRDILVAQHPSAETGSTSHSDDNHDGKFINHFKHFVNKINTEKKQKMLADAGLKKILLDMKQRGQHLSELAAAELKKNLKFSMLFALKKNFWSRLSSTQITTT